MSISVVIPLYNKEQSIVETLNSVKAQTFSDYEVIIVNDGSSDTSAKIVEEWIKNTDGISIRLINKNNGGVCSARNRGIKEAKGDYVAFLDGDDLWDKDYLLEQSKMIADFPNCDIWGINFAKIDSKGNEETDSTGLPSGFRGIISDYFSMSNRISDLCSSSSVVIRKSVCDVVGLFDERVKFAEDNDMWWRIIAYSQLAFYDKVMAYYRQDAENRAMLTYHDLRYYLPFYADKFQNDIFRRNETFYSWINRWCAIKIKHIYFGDANQRENAKIAIKRLDMNVLPHKYKYLFGLPFPLAKLMYVLDERRMKHIPVS